MPFLKSDNEKIKDFYFSRIKKKKDYNIVRFVCGANGKIETVYFHPEAPLVKKNLKMRIATIAICKFDKDKPLFHTPNNTFDQFELHDLNIKAKYYPRDNRMYNEDYDKVKQFILAFQIPPSSNPLSKAFSFEKFKQSLTGSKPIRT